MGTITRLPFRKGSKKTIQTSPDMKLLSAVTESELCIFPSSSLNICIFPFAHHSMKTHHCHLCIKIFKMFQATNIFYRKQTSGSQQCTKQSATSSHLLQTARTQNNMTSYSSSAVCSTALSLTFFFLSSIFITVSK